MSWRNFTVLAFSSQANPTVIASQRRSNPSVVLHYLKYGLPRRFAPRNDKSEWSLRAKGEAIHLSSCTTWNMDCHVALLLAMTGVGVDCHVALLLTMTRGGWIATSLCSSQWQGVGGLPRRFAPRNDGGWVWIATSLCSSQWQGVGGLPRRFAPRNDKGWVDCHVASLLAMTRGGCWLPRRFASRNDGDWERLLRRFSQWRGLRKIALALCFS